MVKVERDGRIKYIKCYSCNSVLSFEEGDECYQGGETWGRTYVVCPCCNSSVTVFESEGFDYMKNYSKVRLEDIK